VQANFADNDFQKKFSLNIRKQFSAEKIENDIGKDCEIIFRTIFSVRKE
jgi:hypothetical protein